MIDDRVAIMSKNQSDIMPNEGLSLGTTQHARSLEYSRCSTIDSLLPNVAEGATELMTKIIIILCS